MSSAELLLTLMACVPAGLLGAWLGRKFQHWHWDWHLPYEERVKILRKGDQR